MIKRIMKRFPALRQRLVDPGCMLLRFMQAIYHSRELKCVQKNTNGIGKSDILLFATLRNEAVRIPFFLKYYKQLGVRHFFFVDNGSDDGFQELVKDEPDVSVWYTKASYKDSNFGMHWLNHLLRRFGSEHWCVTCDPDEFLVYPYCNKRNLYELTAFLESENRRYLCCVMLDMYSDKPIEKTVYTENDNPFHVAPSFDQSGYVQKIGWLKDTFITGGVRRRVFFHDIPEQAPALNKTPLVKWRWSYSYFLSMHQLVPSWLNIYHAGNHNSPTGCVMHFKYFSMLKEKVKEELVRKEHWNDSFEYRKYDVHMTGENETLMYEKSTRYTDWQQLVALGFMNYGQWF